MRKGFTLAEVLITLGIVGVVAAITIPNLMTAYKAHRLRAQFLKSYSVIQQAVRHIESDDVTYTTHDELYSLMGNYLSNKTVCKAKPSNVCYGGGGNRTLEARYKNYSKSTYYLPHLSSFGEYLLSDGTLLLFDRVYISSNNYPYVISVDINGYNTPPNRAGYDLFTFIIEDGMVKPGGAVGTPVSNLDNYCNKTGTSGFNGMGCATKAVFDSNYFKRVAKDFK